MHPKICLPVLLFLAALFVPAWECSAKASKPNASFSKSPAYAPGEILIKYKPGKQNRGACRLKTELRGSSRSISRRQELGLIKVPPELPIEETIDFILDDPDVIYAEPNYLVRVLATPGDTYFPKSWGLHNTGQSILEQKGTPDADIDAPEAWDISTGSHTVVVAVPDTGIDWLHPDLELNIWVNSDEQSNAVDSDGNGYPGDIRGWDFIHEDARPMDASGHGTHVAGIIGARGNNDLGGVGVAWNVSLMPLRFIGANNTGKTSDLIEAIDYALDNGAHLINASFGSPYYSHSLYEALARAKDQGVLVIAAAGNDSLDIDQVPEYPASYPLENIIAVAATDQNDSLAGFSNYGPRRVHVAAPGTAILNSYPARKPVYDTWFESGDSLEKWSLEGDWGRSTSYPVSGDWSLSDSPSSTVTKNRDTAAIGPVLDMGSRHGATLSFSHFAYLSSDDTFTVESAPKETGPWKVQYRFSGTGLEYGETIDLKNLDYDADGYFRFRLNTGSTGGTNGLSIDDLVIEASDSSYSDPNTTYYGYLSGTSMAAPMVTGLAALVLSAEPGLSWQDVKTRILDSAERLPSLQGTSVTGARVNAFATLANIPAPPEDLQAFVESKEQIRLEWQSAYSGGVDCRIGRRKTDQAGYEQRGVVDCNTESFIDTGLEPATSYIYRLQADNGVNLSEPRTVWVSTTSNSMSFARSSEDSSHSSGGGGGGGGCRISSSAAPGWEWLLLVLGPILVRTLSRTRCPRPPRS